MQELAGRVLVAAWLLSVASVSGSQQTVVTLAEMDIEQLMGVEIYSVAKKDETLAESAAAVYVVTGDEIRRSGATTIPEVLRLVPGMEVARLDGSKWAVSARGFNDIFANKLLVLIDGRSVYTPLFSGVFWDTQDIMLEDVEQIEVIRGPGATLWGANAVNGIVNVITRSAMDTQGGLASVSVGTEERNLVSVRYGGRIAPNVHYRIYARRALRDEQVAVTGAPAADGWDMVQSGFRVDADRDRDAAVLEGRLYSAELHQIFRVTELHPPGISLVADDTGTSGGHLLGRWQRQLADDAAVAIRAYYDRSERDEITIVGHVNTWDLDLHHRFQLGRGQEVVWGAGYRVISDRLDEGSPTSSFVPASRTYDIFSAFCQNQIRLSQSLSLILGSKLEHNDFSGFEVQPNARVVWVPRKTASLWGAVSRAVKTPARSDHDLRSNYAVLSAPQDDAESRPLVARLLGDRRFGPEKLVSFELGARGSLANRIQLDAACHYNRYSDLRTVEAELPRLDPSGEFLVAPFVMDDRMRGTTWGWELAADCDVADSWRVRMAYTFLDVAIDLDPDSGYLAGLEWEGYSPRQQISLRSSTDLPGGLELDLWGRGVDELPDGGADAYVDLDMRLSWDCSEGVALSVVGQDLLEPDRTELLTPHWMSLNSYPQRGLYGEVRVLF
jgi:iron complex outermembrane recepter protein